MRHIKLFEQFINELAINESAVSSLKIIKEEYNYNGINPNVIKGKKLSKQQEKAIDNPNWIKAIVANGKVESDVLADENDKPFFFEKYEFGQEIAKQVDGKLVWAHIEIDGNKFLNTSRGPWIITK